MFSPFARRFLHPRVLIAGLFFAISAMSIASFRYGDTDSLIDRIHNGDPNALLSFWWTSTLLSCVVGGAASQLLYDRISSERSLLIPNFRKRLAGFSLRLITLLWAVCFILAAPALYSAPLAAALVSICALVFTCTLVLQLRSVAGIITWLVILPATLIMPGWSLWLAQASPAAVALTCLTFAIVIVRSAHTGEGWLETIDSSEGDPDSGQTREIDVAERPDPIARWQHLPVLHAKGQSLGTVIHNLGAHMAFYISNVFQISPRQILNARAILWGLAAYTAILVASNTFWPRIHVVAEVLLMAVVPGIAIYYLPVTSNGVNFLPRRAQVYVTLWSSITRTLCLVVFVFAAGATAEIVNLLVSTLLFVPNSDVSASNNGLAGMSWWVLYGAAAAPIVVMLRMLTTIPAVAHFTEPWAPMRDFLLFLAFVLCIGSWYNALDVYVGIGDLPVASALVTAIIAHGLYYGLLRWRLAHTDLSMRRA